MIVKITNNSVVTTGFVIPANEVVYIDLSNAAVITDPARSNEIEEVHLPNHGAAGYQIFGVDHTATASATNVHSVEVGTLTDGGYFRVVLSSRAHG